MNVLSHRVPTKTWNKKLRNLNKAKMFDSHSRSFMGNLCACCCWHMDPKGSSLELLQFTCSALGNNQDSWLFYQTNKHHHQRTTGTPVKGPLQSYNIEHDSGFPRIHLCSGHSDCCVYDPWKLCCLCHHWKYVDHKTGNLLKQDYSPHSAI